MPEESVVDNYEKKVKTAEEWAKQNGWGLKSIKLFLAGSEETNCFVADITKDGKVIGNAKNDGHGGSSSIYVGFDKNGRIDGFKEPTKEEYELLEYFVDDAVYKYGNEQETKKVITKIKRKGQKMSGVGYLAYKFVGDEITYFYGPEKYTPQAFEALTSVRGGGYTIVKITSTLPSGS